MVGKGRVAVEDGGRGEGTGEVAGETEGRFFGPGTTTGSAGACAVLSGEEGVDDGVGHGGGFSGGGGFFLEAVGTVGGPGAKSTRWAMVWCLKIFPQK